LVAETLVWTGDVDGLGEMRLLGAVGLWGAPALIDGRDTASAAEQDIDGLGRPRLASCPLPVVFGEDEEVGPRPSADVGDMQTAGSEGVFLDRHAFDLPSPLTPQLASAEVEPATLAIRNHNRVGIANAPDPHPRGRDRKVNIAIAVQVTSGN
jgi:hypothetical protein